MGGIYCEEELDMTSGEVPAWFLDDEQSENDWMKMHALVRERGIHSIRNKKDLFGDEVKENVDADHFTMSMVRVLPAMVVDLVGLR